MTTPAPPLVRCPVCADEISWPDDSKIMIFDEGRRKYEALDIRRLSGAKLLGARRGGYVVCPNPAGDMAPHYLPATYADYRDPLVIGLVGGSTSGKTHLLTAMIREAYLGGLTRYGVTVAALDFRRHKLFTNEFVQPFEQGVELPGTTSGVTEAADILLLRGADGDDRPVTFFDVAGEDLNSTEAMNRSTRHLLGADAVIFAHPMEERQEPGEGPDHGWSFELAVERLLGVPGNASRIPVTIAVTKSDRMRYVPPVERWLRTPAAALDAGRFRDESRDAYAFLHSRGAISSLRPFNAFRRCTLHFVSASGGESSPVDPGANGKERRFVRGIRPANVLTPLVAILAMSGVIKDPEAGKVGLP